MLLCCIVSGCFDRYDFIYNHRSAIGNLLGGRVAAVELALIHNHSDGDAAPRLGDQRLHNTVNWHRRTLKTEFISAIDKSLSGCSSYAGNGIENRAAAIVRLNHLLRMNQGRIVCGDAT